MSLYRSACFGPRPEGSARRIFSAPAVSGRRRRARCSGCRSQGFGSWSRGSWPHTAVSHCLGPTAFLLLGNRISSCRRSPLSALALPSLIFSSLGRKTASGQPCQQRRPADRSARRSRKLRLFRPSAIQAASRQRSRLARRYLPGFNSYGKPCASPPIGQVMMSIRVFGHLAPAHFSLSCVARRAWTNGLDRQRRQFR